MAESVAARGVICENGTVYFIGIGGLGVVEAISAQQISILKALRERPFKRRDLGKTVFPDAHVLTGSQRASLSRSVHSLLEHGYLSQDQDGTVISLTDEGHDLTTWLLETFNYDRVWASRLTR